MATEAPGLFVSFEGIDGSGKSTQARLLAERLRGMGREVVLTREPGGSPGAEEIRRLVLTGDRGRWSAETEILLFTAARRDHLERVIRPALARGAAVVTDRFADSTRLYQGATRGDLRALVDRLHALMIGVEPDLTVVIDMDPKIALSRSLVRLASSETARAASFAASSAAAAASLDFARGAADAAQFAAMAAQAAAQADAITTATKMIEAGDMPEDRYESFGPLFQARLRDGFLRLENEFPSRIVVIDGDRPEGEVAQDVAAVAMARLEPA